MFNVHEYITYRRRRSRSSPPLSSLRSLRCWIWCQGRCYSFWKPTIFFAQYRAVWVWRTGRIALLRWSRLNIGRLYLCFPDDSLLYPIRLHGRHCSIRKSFPFPLALSQDVFHPIQNLRLRKVPGAHGFVLQAGLTSARTTSTCLSLQC